MRIVSRRQTSSDLDSKRLFLAVRVVRMGTGWRQGNQLGGSYIKVWTRHGGSSFDHSVAMRVVRRSQHPGVCVRICPWKWGIREQVKEDYKGLDLSSWNIGSAIIKMRQGERNFVQSLKMKLKTSKVFPARQFGLPSEVPIQQQCSWALARESLPGALLGSSQSYNTESVRPRGCAHSDPSLLLKHAPGNLNSRIPCPTVLNPFSGLVWASSQDPPSWGRPYPSVRPSGSLAAVCKLLGWSPYTRAWVSTQAAVSPSRCSQSLG